MFQRSEIFIKGNYYHIYNRGLDKNPIFYNPANYEYCLRLIQRYKVRYGITVIAYCLMPNHYHLLLRQEGDTPVYRFINSLFNSYVQAVNRQQNRKGPMFEGRYKYVHVDKGDYLIHLCRYIHLNPVKANLTSRPEDWLYSNYSEWVCLQDGSVKDQNFIKDHFTTPMDYASFCENSSEGIERESGSLISKYRFD